MFATDPEMPETMKSSNYTCNLAIKHSIEIAEEQAINNVLDYNKYNLLKKRLDYDLVVMRYCMCKTTVLILQKVLNLNM
jgi:hypothetical protein